jgi:hypothetical protein
MWHNFQEMYQEDEIIQRILSSFCTDKLNTAIVCFIISKSSQGAEDSFENLHDYTKI